MYIPVVQIWRRLAAGHVDAADDSHHGQAVEGQWDGSKVGNFSLGIRYINVEMLDPYILNFCNSFKTSVLSESFAKQGMY